MVIAQATLLGETEPEKKKSLYLPYRSGPHKAIYTAVHSNMFFIKAK